MIAAIVMVCEQTGLFRIFWDFLIEIENCIVFMLKKTFRN